MFAGDCNKLTRYGRSRVTNHPHRLEVLRAFNIIRGSCVASIQISGKDFAGMWLWRRVVDRIHRGRDLSYVHAGWACNFT